ncbi:MAG TPA: LptF/LptG family permease, partial [Tepidisphaeraceae bacterium]|nr:LptF/LptG family permease [Tepidisphaeraceae bacterium]
ATTFGPMLFPSPIHENVKFMDVRKLAKLAADPSRSQRVAEALDDLIRIDEQRTFLQGVARAINVSGTAYFPTALNEQYIVSTDNPSPPGMEGDELVFNSEGGTRQISLTKENGEQQTLTAQAGTVKIHARPDEVDSQMVVTIDMYDLVLTELGAESIERPAWSATFNVAMPAAVLSVRNNRDLESYLRQRSIGPSAANFLYRSEIVVYNAVRGELHSRVNFALSCLILVMMGCALGMMFKSGNFLSAFAISFVPALLCITLNVGGQQTANRVPDLVPKNFLLHNSPLHTGLILIWGGNLFVLALAIGLVCKLVRR